MQCNLISSGVNESSFFTITALTASVVFLSGTPIINKPSEIAYLFNMLKGRIDVFDFSIKVDGDIDDISKRFWFQYYR